MQTTAEQFLKSFHSTNPGCTPEAVGWGDTQLGLTSYETVIQKIGTSQGPILDLACGNGHLLEQFVRHGHDSGNLYGIDMSDAELELARKNSKLSAATLVQGNARRMPFDSDYFSAVTCHMALMLMPRVHEVLREVVRVLRHGGVFCSFINSRGPVTPAREIYNDVMSEYVRLDQQVTLKNMTDSRLMTPFEIEALYRDHFDCLDIEEGVLKFSAPPAEILKCFITMYNSHFLTSTQLEKMSAQLMREFARITDANGNVRHDMHFRLITARKPQA